MIERENRVVAVGRLLLPTPKLDESVFSRMLSAMHDAKDIATWDFRHERCSKSRATGTANDRVQEAHVTASWLPTSPSKRTWLAIGH